MKKRRQKECIDGGVSVGVSVEERRSAFQLQILLGICDFGKWFESSYDTGRVFRNVASRHSSIDKWVPPLNSAGEDL